MLMNYEREENKNPAIERRDEFIKAILLFL